MRKKNKQSVIIKSLKTVATMKKLFSLFLIFAIIGTSVTQAQTIKDTGTLRKTIKDIKANTIRQTNTGTTLNRVLNGFLNTPQSNLPYTWYEGFITQSSTSAPTFTTIYNNTGLTIGSAYDSIGRYFITGATAVTATKLWYQITNASGFAAVSRVGSGGNAGKIQIVTKDTGNVQINGILSNSPIVIKVYR